MTERKEHNLDDIEKEQKGDTKDRIHGNLASFFSAYISLTNTVVGSGILGLPYAFSCTGWTLGCLLLVICAVLSSVSLHLLALCGARTAKPSSFYSVAEIVSPGYTFIIDIAVAVKCFGVATSYLIVIGDLMPDVMVELNATEMLLRRSTWVIIGWLILVPLSFLDSLNAFKWTSTISVVFIGIITCVVIAFAMPSLSGLQPCSGRRSLSVLADTISELKNIKNFLKIGINSMPSKGGNKCVGDFLTIESDPYKILKVIPIFVFGFTCQQNIFAVTNELRLPTQQRISGVIISSQLTALVMYGAVAIFGYFTFGSLVHSDILTNYPDNILTSMARLSVSIMVMLSYPLQCIPSRKSLLTLWNGLIPLNDKKISQGQQLLRYRLITCFFLIISLGISLVFSDLGVILSLVGATGSTVVSYILPGAFYLSLYKQDIIMQENKENINQIKERNLNDVNINVKEYKNKRLYDWKVLAAMLLLTIGVVLIPVSLVVLLTPYFKYFLL